MVKRLYEVARELGLQNRQVEEDLEAMGCPVRSFASPVNETELSELYAKYGRVPSDSQPDDASNASSDLPGAEDS
ncbi:translation initiation factor IF-2 N-terminal domain-containing protein [Catenulispora sp. NF23]|uniref:Translation initiation factor IF-2 N-terminal domain-containing protein n=1 Tax=Catenulispora pinistramenti TaxID=2705254 RepID=A0ABS5KMY4_9ACTN|nr:translation initiation factor IF-2 N-terminal domain-containing protein [Catenulispora pinistramenti]MBS2531881.1 translation initiation factor IF-2 N-terminal domain-containing protein [Catenulispora pinistramenti]MBS2547360.1 translation initiation factor IF-2 N-terminal domain-containing protein [Catenulispora pinistramenti]